MSRPVLVIGYGNTLRRDDGLGPRIAAEVAARTWAGVETLALPQLLPELAEHLAGCRLAIFVDARCDLPEEPIGVHAIVPAADAPRTHGSDPAALLALALELFGRASPAWWVTVAGHDFGWGEGISPTAEHLIPEAVGRIQSLVQAATELPCTNLS